MNDKEFKEWEKETENAEKKNSLLIESFQKYLSSKSLKQQTIQNHLDNVDFFVNDFLLRYKIIPAEKGADEVGEFLGDFFIRKAMWSNKAAIQQNIASFNKFYTFLNEIGKLSDEDLFEMKLMIKEEKSTWFERVEKFNSSGDDWF
jgi:hypothetical protein